MWRLTCCPESGCGSSRAVSWGKPVPRPVYAAQSPSPVRIQTRQKQEVEEERQSQAWVEEGAGLPVDRVGVEEGAGLQGEVEEGAELLVDWVGLQGEAEEGAVLRGEAEEEAGHVQVQVRAEQEEGRSYRVEEAVLDPHPDSC